MNTPQGAFNVMVWNMLRDLAKQTSAFHEISRLHIINPDARPALMPGSKPDATLSLPAVVREPPLRITA